MLSTRYGRQPSPVERCVAMAKHRNMDSLPEWSKGVDSMQKFEFVLLFFAWPDSETTLGRTPEGSYSLRGRSRHLLENPLLRTPFENPCPKPSPEPSLRTLSDLFWTRLQCIPEFGAENQIALFQDFILLSACSFGGFPSSAIFSQIQPFSANSVKTQPFSAICIQMG